jgi:hypothetical protein
VGIMRYISVLFLLLNLLLAGCTLSSITEPFTSLITKSESVDKDKAETIKITKASSRIISVKGKHIKEDSIVSEKEIKKDYNTIES